MKKYLLFFTIVFLLVGFTPSYESTHATDSAYKTTLSNPDISTQTEPDGIS
jgi:hypothetical protein